MCYHTCILSVFSRKTGTEKCSNSLFLLCVFGNGMQHTSLPPIVSGSDTCVIIHVSSKCNTWYARMWKLSSYWPLTLSNVMSFSMIFFKEKSLVNLFPKQSLLSRYLWSVIEEAYWRSLSKMWPEWDMKQPTHHLTSFLSSPSNFLSSDSS